jgi:hypothetical protein
MNNLIGKRIRMTETMSDDPRPIEKGEMGTIRHVGGGVINVSWDNGRSIGVIEGKDQYEIIDEHIDTYLPKNNFLVFSGNV